jgi:hypothetical protein
MSLPKLNSSYKYELTLPVSKRKHKYRPYLVKEEKALLMANESGEQADMVKAMMDILDSCFEGMDSASLALADMEFAFAHVRGRSAGENVDLTVPCSECEKNVNTQINLLDVACTEAEEAPNSFEIETEAGTWRVTMRYPTFRSVAETANTESEVDTAFLLMADMRDTLLTEEDTFRFDDSPLEERVEFLESMSGEHLLHVRKYMDAMPSVKVDVNFTCPSCKTVNNQTLSGLQNFFG